jgi:murein DD-endopeptidase MepM/ murein hydrolase activator NlpD
MGKALSVLGSHQALRFALAGCLAALLAGCADSERLSDPLGNPFHTAAVDRTPTGSIAAPTRPVRSEPLAAPANYVQQAPAQPAPHLAPPPAPSGKSASIAGWTAEGGMPVVVAQGESAGIIAQRYGIPEAALLRTNGFASAGQVRPGTRLVIPIYNASLAASSGAHVGAPRREMAERQVPEHQAAERQAAERQAAAAHAKVAKAEHAKEVKEARVEAKEKERREEKPAKIEHPTLAKVESKDAPPKIEKASLTQSVAIAPKPAVVATTQAAPHAEEKTADAASASPEFRWPARGRIVHGFSGNDGIDIALPEGTPVKAAEAGVVAYAGNELKGYGNLVLIRHPNGFVTAYANNGEIDVKRGEMVKRGQVIAKSGQTGNATSPQLHFEVRKGAKPVDPVHYLAGL